MPGTYYVVLLSFILIPQLTQTQAITHFIKHVDHKESVPKAMGHTPKYSTWVFSNDDWNTIAIVIKVLKVLFFFFHPSTIDIVLGYKLCSAIIFWNIKGT